MRYFRALPAAACRSLLVAATLIAATSVLEAADIDVAIDQARVIRLEQPGAGVIVGNPSIADVSVQNGRLLVVTGKSVGITNLIVLDAQDRQIMSRRISVGHDTRRIVTVHKGPLQYSFNCRPTCRPALMPGDAEMYFEPLAKGTRNKLGIAQSVLEGTQAPQ